MSKMFAVDVPPRNPSSQESWHEVNVFASREEAIEFVKKYYGADDDGRVCLVTAIGGDDDEE
jgi:hypothetical protein